MGAGKAWLVTRDVLYTLTSFPFQFMCTLDNSPLATTVVGQLKVNVSSVVALYLWRISMTRTQVPNAHHTT